MKNYELTYLVSTDCSDEDLKNLFGKISGFVSKEGGIPGKSESPARKKLGYPIKKREEAFLIILNFSLNQEKLDNLRKNLGSENKIIRYAILNKKPAQRKEIERKLRRSKREISEKTIKIKEDSKKVDLKEIDKKIEEILKE